MLVVWMHMQVHDVRIVSVTYHPASSKVSTNDWYGIVSCWIVLVGPLSWHNVNLTNCRLKLWVVQCVVMTRMSSYESKKAMARSCVAKACV